MNIPQRALLACGLWSSLLYVVVDVAASLCYDGYSYRSQTISELSAIGAPTRPFMTAFVFVYNTLLIGLGWGVWRAAGATRAMRVAAVALVANGVVGFAAPAASMHRREVLAAGLGTSSDVLHIVLASLHALFFLLMAALGTRMLGRGFRRYSASTLVALLAFGALTYLDGLRLDSRPTPWLGINERVLVYSGMAWIAVLAVVLGRSHSHGAAAST